MEHCILLSFAFFIKCLVSNSDLNKQTFKMLINIGSLRLTTIHLSPFKVETALGKNDL